MSTVGETGSQGGEETDQLSTLLGRPKCFSGREGEWQDWSHKFGATAATLSDHASVWMGDALKMTAEITLDQSNQAAARIFARQLCTMQSVNFLLLCSRDEATVQTVQKAQRFHVPCAVLG